ncbi:hypothetical protein E0F15_01455 [Frankia sp. B2]|uniref:hypothetical protein n=1 Tax=unclassified Frankia TaxID=2632575 RepID=UPI000461782C|nr:MULTISPECIES: hypothetical protein [unclassified Frankia]KDA41073.1 hypothetical protein BMG523Draft_04119 [Frankia sp. BMG5.23]ORT46883.1 hypothetical protein KBI5_22775 [Frankia sp. KB5]TFE35541.1 hypothetical protein E0F15_01455 [Frankia sp. B2]
MNPPTHRVAIHPHHQLTGPDTAVGYTLPYLPDGCPDDLEGWPARDGQYPGPHQNTVCPTCLPTHRHHADVCNPFPVPTPTPMIYALESAPQLADGGHDLLHLLRAAGFTRLAWLPLAGYSDPYVFVADHPTDHSRIILDRHGLEFHPRDPATGGPFHDVLGPRTDLAAVTTVPRSAGHTTPTPRPATGLPPLPPGARLLSADDAARLIIMGDHPAGQNPDLAYDLGLVDALHRGAILAAHLPDGNLAFTPNPHPHNPTP